jgi:hypothetical protein
MAKYDDDDILRLGVRPRAMVISGAVVRYISGCITRERERLARALKGHISDDPIAAIVSDEHDDLVFKWIGPGAKLDDPPKPADPLPPPDERPGGKKNRSKK